MKNVKLSASLFALGASVGCGLSGPESHGGAADEIHSDALTRFAANVATEDELVNDVGLTSRATNAILAARVGEDGKAGTADDVTFVTAKQIDALTGVGPASMDALEAYGARRLKSAPSLELMVLASKGGPDLVEMTRYAAQIAEQGLAPLPQSIAVKPKRRPNDKQWDDVVARIEGEVSEALGFRLFGVDLATTPNPELNTICYRDGKPEDIILSIEGLRGAGLGLYFGLQAVRYGKTVQTFGPYMDSRLTEYNWKRFQREENENRAQIEAWEAFDASSGVLLATDLGQDGDGTELYLVTVRPCD